MKKRIKIIIGGIGVILILFIIDLVCIFTINRPLFVIKNEENVYKGIFYDTYKCAEYSIPQIKLKGTKFFCSNVNINKAASITNTRENIKRFASDEVKESFYEDNNYSLLTTLNKVEYADTNILVRFNDVLYAKSNKIMKPIQKKY